MTPNPGDGNIRVSDGDILEAFRDLTRREIDVIIRTIIGDHRELKEGGRWGKMDVHLGPNLDGNVSLPPHWQNLDNRLGLYRRIGDTHLLVDEATKAAKEAEEGGKLEEAIRLYQTAGDVKYPIVSRRRRLENLESWSSSIVEEVEYFVHLAELAQKKGDENSTQTYFERAVFGPDEYKPRWAILELRSAPHVRVRDIFSAAELYGNLEECARKLNISTKKEAARAYKEETYQKAYDLARTLLRDGDTEQKLDVGIETLRGMVKYKGSEKGTVRYFADVVMSAAQERINAKTKMWQLLKELLWGNSWLTNMTISETAKKGGEAAAAINDGLRLQYFETIRKKYE